MTSKPTVLMVSKPITPPWNDSGKNLVKDLVSHGSRFRYRVLSTPGYQLPREHVVCEPIYANSGKFSPSFAANARVMARLCRSDDAHLRHYFFAPNPLTSQAARLITWLRSTPTVQTVASLPRPEHRAGHLFFADRVIALSRFSRRHLLETGLAAERVVHIPPCIEVPGIDGEARARGRCRHELSGAVILFPGDYQFSHAARTVADALPWVTTQRSDVTLVFACRIKQAASRDEEARIRATLARSGNLGRARFLNDVPSMLDLVAAADVVTLPAESTYAKMDLPLVLLEAMALERPVVVAAGGPLGELAADDAAVTVSPGDAPALGRALLALLEDPSRRRGLGEQARRACQERYAAPDIARRHEELYLDLLSRYCLPITERVHP